MELKVSHCFIAVHDHDEALAFYRDVLGLEVRNDVKYEGVRRVTVGPKVQPEVNIVLEPPAANPNASPLDKQVMSQLLADGMLRSVIFATDDCDATFEHVCRAGAEVMQEPMDNGRPRPRHRRRAPHHCRDDGQGQLRRSYPGHRRPRWHLRGCRPAAPKSSRSRPSSPTGFATAPSAIPLATSSASTSGAEPTRSPRAGRPHLYLYAPVALAA